MSIYDLLRCVAFKYLTTNILMPNLSNVKSRAPTRYGNLEKI